MYQPQFLQVLRNLGFVFWLSLPLIGLVFWLGSGLIGDQILSRTHNHKKYLQADTRLTRQMMKKVVAIEAEIRQPQGISLVKVTTNHVVLKTMIFEFSIIEPQRLEAKLSRELGLSQERVKELIRYETVQQ
ncbi:hypothetical protein Nos7524_3149 [Nostoc sp. PCC 7524]|uniref:hypothetical protein n=1 Tax=Nostoc sp. (strain ATCC 29411 / PCC 7524) TaxID=28072 RepID=UPI00029F1A49|nr:hypothetical protein [Nostoc sp. PCC 7524]AFY48952.1 hypothetical protein Nos7524_3149 [Nostoc sp. PCC 7524]